MSFEEAIKTIIYLNEEVKAVQMLMDSIRKNTEKLEKENSEMHACLRAIKKINNGENDDINSLCEV